MPQVTVYVREEDLAKWKAIEKKAEWLHLKLSGGIEPIIVPAGVDIVPGPDRSKLAPPKKFVPSPPDPETGYPCCQGTKPCRHWHFNGDTQLWTNEITGKTKEPGA